MATENNNNTPKENQGPQSEGRRNALKALATIPVLGALGYGVYKKQTYDKKSKSLGSAFKFDKEHYMIPAQPDGKKIRIGMIGFGIRGKQLMRAAGFAEPSWIDGLMEGAKNDSKDKRYEQFLEQDDLNIEVTGVCDIFDVYGEAAVLAASNIHREGSNGKFGKRPKRYRTYKNCWRPMTSTQLLSLLPTIGTVRWRWKQLKPESMSMWKNRCRGQFLRLIRCARW